MPSDRNPLLIGVHVAPPSSVRKAPAAEIAMNIRCGFFGSRRIVCSPSPPAPGAQKRPDPWPRRPGSSFHVCPPSVVRNIAASSTPAYTVSGSVSDGSKCQTRLNSHGCGVPSYHWCVPGTPSYTTLTDCVFVVYAKRLRGHSVCSIHRGSTLAEEDLDAHENHAALQEDSAFEEVAEDDARASRRRHGSDRHGVRRDGRQDVLA